MKAPDFNTGFMVDQSPDDVFKAVTNVRGWWSQNIEGETAALNDEFTYRYTDQHICTVRLIEVVPGQKVVWQILDNYFKFTEDTTEWTGTIIVFDISQQDDKTHLHFTHRGLVPEFECYEICFDAWTRYVTKSLRSLITTGKGQPNAREAEVA